MMYDDHSVMNKQSASMQKHLKAALVIRAHLVGE